MRNYRQYDEIRRGDIFMAALENEGNIQTGFRPVLIIQNDKGNTFSPNVIVVPLTSRAKKFIPTHVAIAAGMGGLERDSIALAEQPMTISKEILADYIGRISDDEVMMAVNSALLISLGISSVA